MGQSSATYYEEQMRKLLSERQSDIDALFALHHEMNARVESLLKEVKNIRENKGIFQGYRLRKACQKKDKAIAELARIKDIIFAICHFYIFIDSHGIKDESYLKLGFLLVDTTVGKYDKKTSTIIGNFIAMKRTFEECFAV